LGHGSGDRRTRTFQPPGTDRCSDHVDQRVSSILPSPLEPVAGAVLLAVGAVLGALVATLLIAPVRARRLARLVDDLAEAMGSGDPRVRESDSVDESGFDPRSWRRPSSSFGGLVERLGAIATLASTDALTRVTNRQASLRTLTEEIGRANRYERPLAVALIDVDHFKRVNDTHGHAVGDAVLRHVAGLLEANVRSVDTLGRYGGEEFIVLMPETDVDGGLASAENLRRVIGRSTHLHEDQKIGVTISVGVAGGNGSASLDFEAILRQADIALYNAKAQGRDQVQPFRTVDDEAGVRRATIDVAARSEAQRIGQAAFDASNSHLMQALSERPGWAGGASQLIARIASEVARSVGLPENDVDRIRTASLLHDLGKLAIPDEILSKPAALNAHEWRTIIEHPKIGQVVLEQAGSIRDAAAIVLHHHEWFDGRGYPHGLAGSEIPLGSRIVAIADAYEAMISHRPYKAAMNHAQALAELRRQAGVQFDPALVALFVDLFAAGVDDPRARPARTRSAAGARVRAS
jgi:diguanylate cyclase (GGDEF)-like protein